MLTYNLKIDFRENYKLLSAVFDTEKAIPLDGEKQPNELAADRQTVEISVNLNISPAHKK